MRRIWITLTVAPLLILAGGASAEDLAVPHPFSPGTTISSTEMNENFSAIYQRFNALAMRVLNLETNQQTGWFVAVPGAIGRSTSAPRTAATTARLAAATTALASAS